MEMEPRRGAIAMCSRGYIGLITSAEPQEITYPDGNKGKAWLGIQLTNKPPISANWDKPHGVGTPWSSRTPFVMGYIDERGVDLNVACNQHDPCIWEQRQSLWKKPWFPTCLEYDRNPTAADPPKYCPYCGKPVRRKK